MDKSGWQIGDFLADTRTTPEFRVWGPSGPRRVLFWEAGEVVGDFILMEGRFYRVTGDVGYSYEDEAPAWPA